MIIFNICKLEITVCQQWEKNNWKNTYVRRWVNICVNGHPHTSRTLLTANKPLLYRPKREANLRKVRDKVPLNKTDDSWAIREKNGSHISPLGHSASRCAKQNVLRMRYLHNRQCIPTDPSLTPHQLASKGNNRGFTRFVRGLSSVFFLFSTLSYCTALQYCTVQ